MSSAIKGGQNDLPADLQRELEELSAREGRISHYALLGIAGDADAGAVRRAYLEKSRRYHPDAYYGRNLGTYGPLLARAFQRINHAYQLLSDETARVAYDKEAGGLFSGDEQTRVAKRHLDEADEARRGQEARERLLRMKGFARLGAARQLYEQALLHATDGQRARAIAELKTARELDPTRKEIAVRLAEIEKDQVKARATSALVAAQEQEQSGDATKALSLYATAFQLDPRAHQAALGAARCALAKGDFTQLLSFALRACELAPKNMEAHLAAARAFAGLKQKPRAKAELQLVLTNDPGNAEAKALLKSL